MRVISDDIHACWPNVVFVLVLAMTSRNHDRSPPSLLYGFSS